MRDPVAELSKALGPVREALQRWEEIQATHKARCDTSAYEKHLAKAQAEFEKTQTPDTHERVFLARACDERASNNSGHRATRRVSRGVRATVDTVSNVREKVKRACEWKIEVAKRELENVRATEQSRLGPKYDASESPIVKDYAGSLRRGRAIREP
jgi:hypothetical protein